jgi:cytochrome c biogenesis protein CcmG/thiol:disulfide interchange protein DsbE
MRRLFLFIPLAIFIALGVLFWQGLKLDPTELPTALLNKPVPTFSLPALGNKDEMLTQDSLKGKPALLNVWATWCPTCKEEHAQLNKISREEGVTIYGINYKDERASANDWLARYSNPYVVNIYDEAGSLGLDLGVYVAPETYVIDASGIIRYRHVGAVDQAVWEKLRTILQQVSEPKTVQGEAS